MSRRQPAHRIRICEPARTLAFDESPVLRTAGIRPPSRLAWFALGAIATMLVMLLA